MTTVSAGPTPTVRASTCVPAKGGAVDFLIKPAQEANYSVRSKLQPNETAIDYIIWLLPVVLKHLHGERKRF